MRARKNWSRDAIADYWERYGLRYATTKSCWCCGRLDSRLERAHIVALCDGGSDTVDNIHLLCGPCHRATEGMTTDEYWAYFDNYPHTWLTPLLHWLCEAAAGFPTPDLLTTDDLVHAVRLQHVAMGQRIEALIAKVAA